MKNHLENLHSYKEIQKIAYESVLEVESSLQEGITEKETATELDKVLHRKGINHFFHASFAWFGDRTSFTHFHTYFDFLPTERKLEKGMPVILDTAPALHGFPCDIGYSFAFGKNEILEKANQDLKLFRELILEGILQEKTLSRIYQEVDELILDLGYRNCHQKYPAQVLGHKVGKLPYLQLPNFKIMGFQPQTYLYLLGETLEGILPKFPIFPNTEVPYWNHTTHHKAEIGIWAVEPHIGKEGVGAKWEELLIVTEETAYWLDDDLPHVTRGKAKKEILSV
jgi:Xaa-Pro aminopeptidase